MADDKLQNSVLGSSVLVTGSHYSMTTLVGRLLAEAPEFHFLYEPTNARPTFSYDSLRPGNWYEFYDDGRAGELADLLLRFVRSEGMSRQIVQRITEIRSVPEALQVARYVQRKLPMRFVRKPAIIKDPFLLFSAPALQRSSGIKIVLTVRHPCAFAESFTRAGHGFDFANFLQPELLEAMPAEAHAITQMASSPSRLIEQAALLWRVLYGFADTYLIGNPSTFVVRQEELVRKTDETIARLFIFSGASQTEKIRRFVGRNFSADTADFARSGSYFRRDSAKVLEKWHGRLTEDEVLVIRTATEPLASKLGYGAESWSPASTPSL